jgi:hypothetical protein
VRPAKPARIKPPRPAAAQPKPKPPERVKEPQPVADAPGRVRHEKLPPGR